MRWLHKIFHQLQRPPSQPLPMRKCKDDDQDGPTFVRCSHPSDTLTSVA
ncbi:23047_t:CDS:2 [Gigaspora margarita]|uniref:23047_t:CDS:1 n=1 Tax=Gigaspora margarita TaxID=4874 RepID=A0ABN7UPE1_GIGMA|nr:23047_t:CDS:2 [Gigaspora margarita]